MVELSGPQGLQIGCNHFPSAQRQTASGIEGERQQQQLRMYCIYAHLSCADI